MSSGSIEPSRCMCNSAFGMASINLFRGRVITGTQYANWLTIGGSSMRIRTLFAILLLTVFAFQVHAQTKPLKKVRIAVGTTNLNVGYPWLTLPLSLDYWRQEGYEVEVLPVG